MEAFFSALLGAMVGALTGTIAGLIIGLIGPLVVAYAASQERRKLQKQLRVLQQRLVEVELGVPAADAPAPQTAPSAPPQADVEPDTESKPEAEPEAEAEAEAELPEDEQTQVAPEPARAAASSAFPPASGRRNRGATGLEWLPDLSQVKAPSPERVVVWIAAAIGAFMLIVGVLFGLVAVARTGWFGPSTRVAMSLVGGTVVWVFAGVLRGRVLVLPSALEGVAMGTLFGGIFAMGTYYSLIGPLPTFGLLVAVSGVAALRAVVHNDRFMAHLGLIGGLMAPILVSTGESTGVGLFAYLFLLMIGTVSAAAFRGWFDVIALAATGTGLLFSAWSIGSYAPQSVPVALVAAFALAIPFGAAVARTPKETSFSGVAVTVAGTYGAALFPLLATAWVLPVDSAFTDPRTGVLIVQAQGPAIWFGAAAVSLLSIPLLIGARVRQQLLIALVGTAVAIPALMTWFGGWAAVEQEVTPLLVAGLLGPLAVGLLIYIAERGTGAALAALALATGLLLGTAPLIGVASSLFGVSVIAFAVLAALGPWTSSDGALSLAGVLSLAFALTMGGLMVEDIGAAWLVGPTLASLTLLSVPALAGRWTDDRVPVLSHLGAVLAAPLFAPALYLAWRHGLGEGVIGLLPVLIGGYGLLTAGVLVRAHKVKSSDPTLAVAVGVALLGLTFALPLQVWEKWLTVGWALEAAALGWLSTKLTHPLLRWSSVVLGLTIGVRLLINPWALAWGHAGGWPILNWTLYTWGVPTLCLVAAAYWVQQSKPEKGPDLLMPAPVMLRLLAMLTGFALVNVQVSHAFQDAGPLELGGQTTLQGMVRSLAWGGWGMTLLIIGLVVASRYTRFLGFSFLLLAAAKVLVYDIWSLPGFVRVGSLMGLGIILLVAAFLFERLVLRDGTTPDDEATKADPTDSSESSEPGAD